MSSRNPTPLLKIPSENGSPVNEYRVHRGHIEFRATDSHGKPYAYSHGLWTALGARDLELHFALNTPVAQWLLERLKKSRITSLRLGATPLDAT